MEFRILCGGQCHLIASLCAGGYPPRGGGAFGEYTFMAKNISLNI